MLNVELKKAQVKIQEMAFVLVAVMILFALAALIFFSVKINSMKEQATLLKEEQTASLVRYISGIPELSWNCPGCIDFDKALALSRQDKNAFANFFELDSLELEVLYPKQNEEFCVLGSYPLCSKLVIINKTGNFGISSSAFVTLCRWSSEKQQQVCALGKVYASGTGVGKQ